jgi:hypothetical protein
MRAGVHSPQSQPGPTRSNLPQLSSTQFNLVQPSSTKFNQVQPSSTKFNQVQPSSTEFNQVQPSSTTLNQVQPSSTDFNRAHPDLRLERVIHRNKPRKIGLDKYRPVKTHDAPIIGSRVLNILTGKAKRTKVMGERLLHTSTKQLNLPTACETVSAKTTRPPFFHLPLPTTNNRLDAPRHNDMNETVPVYLLPATTVAAVQVVRSVFAWPIAEPGHVNELRGQHIPFPVQRGAGSGRCGHL